MDARWNDGQLWPADLRLGTLLQLEATQAGRGVDWRAYVGGRLLLPSGADPPFGLLAELVPPDLAVARTIAARWRVDPEVLWLVTRSALELLRGVRSADR